MKPAAIVACRFAAGILAVLGGAAGFCSRIAEATAAADFTIAVMDPLAAPLSCPCVKGYAQRDYEKLGAYLEKRLGRATHVVFAEDLGKALHASPTHRLDLIVGKYSVVRFDANQYHLKVRPLATLTGKDGGTTIEGWFVVAMADPAKSIADLRGYTVLFGPAEADEKHAAAIAALQEAGIRVPEKVETRAGCSDAALDILDNKGPVPLAGLISSYAAPLLEGCGTVPKGAIRVVGHTRAVPFIGCFATAAVDAASGRQIVAALLAAKDDAAVMKALETKDGFVPADAQALDSKFETRKSLPQPAKRPEQCVPPTPGASASEKVSSWPQWRGPQRDGHVPYLPDRLPAAAQFVWKVAMSGAGLSGIAATREVVIVADRDAADQDDVFHALHAADGRELWKVQYAAPASWITATRRATPLVHEGRVYLLGAFGHLHCVRLVDGSPLWEKNICREFAAELPRWGMTSSPLIVDGKLIVNPGAKQAALVALDPANGNVLWQTPGNAAAYASFIVGRFGGVRQIVGYDAISLGGWDPASGKRLWHLFPPERGDFNVPTPLDLDGKLLVATENNHTRLYGFDSSGKILSKPLARYDDLSPDASTPLAIGGRVFGSSDGLHCLDAATLKPLWTASTVVDSQVSFLASAQQLLVATSHGELYLLSTHAAAYHCLSRLTVFPGRSDVISHPAMVDHRLYLRSGNEVACVELP